jgi:hypothetical protein
VQLDAELNYNPQYAQNNTHHNTHNTHHFETELNYNPQYTQNRHQNTNNTHHTQTNTHHTHNTFNDYTNNIEPLNAPNNQTEPLRTPEEKIRKPPVQSKPSIPSGFQEELMKSVQKQKEKLENAKIPVAVAEPLENNSNSNPHQGLNISSSSLLEASQPPIIITNPQAVAEGSGSYDNLRVVDLQELCRQRGLAVYGSKEDVIQRLLANDNGESYTRKYKKKAKDNQTK